MAHFFRYFPFVVTTDSNNVACNFYSALALLFWSNFSGTLKNKSEQLVSNATVCRLDLVLMNSVTKALAATDRYIVLFILGCFIVLMLNTLVSTLKQDKVQEVF